MSAFQAPVGTRDVLAPESTRWQHLIGLFAARANAAGYGLVISPMFEDIGVFRRGVGEESEVVTKEMYEFEDKGGRHLALRPEGTAPVVRAFVQHHPTTPWKTWYVTPGFRYERPQAGRYRQFHQLGVEVLGSEDPDLDVEVIALAQGFISDLGLSNTDLKVNSLGDGNCRPQYLELLRGFLNSRVGELCAEHTRRAGKKIRCAFSTVKSPNVSRCVMRYRNSLIHCANRAARTLRGWQRGLDSLLVPWRRDEYLVRGLDYYMRTTFEFAALGLDAAQNAVAGGGRYDGLAAALGGKETPGIGFAAGIERLLLACDTEGAFSDGLSLTDVFVVDLTDGAQARDVTHQLRNAGFSADRAFDGRSAKSQFKQADRSGARLVVVIGTDELESGTVTLRLLRGDDDKQQQSVRREELVEVVQQWLK